MDLVLIRNKKIVRSDINSDTLLGKELGLLLGTDKRNVHCTLLYCILCDGAGL